MKKLLFFSFGLLALTSCKKYTCVCETYDYNSGIYTSYTTTVKARGIVDAANKCNAEGNSNTDCYLD